MPTKIPQRAANQIDMQDEEPDDWQEIQRKLDQQYQKKLKEVSEDALRQLQEHRNEHRLLLKKTQYLVEHSKNAQGPFEEEFNVD